MLSYVLLSLRVASLLIRYLDVRFFGRREENIREVSKGDTLKGKEFLAIVEENEKALLKTLEELRRENSQWTKDFA